jgi:hypothetical protein
VGTVKVLALGSSVCIAGVDGPSVGRVQHERVAMLAQAVQMRARG